MHLDIVRAWKDRRYRKSLSAEQQAGLPEHPAGLALYEEKLAIVMGTSLGKDLEEVASGVASSATLSQNGGLNVGIPDINALVPVLAVPVGTQQNPQRFMTDR